MLGGQSLDELKKRPTSAVTTNPAMTPGTFLLLLLSPPLLPLRVLEDAGANQTMRSVMITFCIERNRFSPYVENGKSLR